MFAFPWLGVLNIFFFVLAGCADDIKGEKGDPGPPGQAASVSVAGLPRPHYEFSPDRQDQVIVRASTSHATRVAIDEVLYTNTSDVFIDLQATGRNGMDGSPVAPFLIYYLYAIPALGDSLHFDLVASSKDPAAGPTGFEQKWTYLGAFRTNGSSKVQNFVHEDNTVFLLEAEPINGLPNDGRDTVYTEITRLKVPKTARVAMIKNVIYMTGIIPQTGAILWSLDKMSGYQIHLAQGLDTGVSHGDEKIISLPLTSPDQKFFYKWSPLPQGWFAFASLEGWVESTSEWQ